MTTYTITATLKADTNIDPVEMRWATNTNEMGVIQSVAQLIEHNKDESPWNPQTLSITITFNQ